MSIWRDIHERSNGETIRKEDLDTKIREGLETFEDIHKHMYQLANVSPASVFVGVVVRDRSTNELKPKVVECVCAHYIMLSSFEQHRTIVLDKNIEKIREEVGDDTFVTILT